MRLTFEVGIAIDILCSTSVMCTLTRLVFLDVSLVRTEEYNNYVLGMVALLQYAEHVKELMCLNACRLDQPYDQYYSYGVAISWAWELHFGVAKSLWTVLLPAGLAQHRRDWLSSAKSMAVSCVYVIFMAVRSHQFFQSAHLSIFCALL